MKKFRKITSLLLLFGFVFVLFSTIGLELAPHGRNAAAGWSFMGFGKESLKHIHSVFGYAALILAAIHGLINAKPIISYVKRDKSGFTPSKTVVLATAVTAVLTSLIFITGSPQKIKTASRDQTQNVEISAHITHN